MPDKLIPGPIQPGEFRVRWTEEHPGPEKMGEFNRVKKRLKHALRQHHQIGLDSDGFEVWVLR